MNLPTTNEHAVKFINQTLKYEGRIFKVIQKTLEHEDGTQFTRDVVIKNPSVIGMVINQDNQVYVQREYRAGISCVTNGFPSGIIEKGETPYRAISREIKEETGYTVKEIKECKMLSLSEGFTNEAQFTFIAYVNTNSQKQDELNLDNDERIIKGEWINFDELKDIKITSASAQYLIQYFKSSDVYNNLLN